MLIAFPTLQTICNKSGYSKPTVIKSIKRLEDAHYLQIIPRIGTSNAYLIALQQHLYKHKSNH